MSIGFNSPVANECLRFFTLAEFLSDFTEVTQDDIILSVWKVARISSPESCQLYSHTFAKITHVMTQLCDSAFLIDYTGYTTRNVVAYIRVSVVKTTYSTTRLYTWDGTFNIVRFCDKNSFLEYSSLSKYFCANSPNIKWNISVIMCSVSTLFPLLGQCTPVVIVKVVRVRFWV